MLDRDRDKRGSALAVVVGSTLAILCLASLLFTFGQVLGQQQGYSVEAAAKHEANAKQQASETCVIVAPTRMFECVYEAVETAQESQRDEQDLYAQQGMHFWAVSMVLVGFLQTLVAGAALWFLKADLAQNRISAERQLRAYITLEPGGVHEAVNGLHALPYVIKNAGQTPAYNLAVFGEILVVSGEPREFDPATHGRLGEAEALTDITLGPGQTQWHYAHQNTELFQPFMEAIRDKESAIVHYGFLQYRDAFGRPQKTCFAFYHWGEHLTDADSKRCRFGNYAT